jgi:RecA-family ATPase
VVEDSGAGLLVLDSLAAVYGANENDRGQVRDFMASWDAWASAADCTILIIGHPPKSAAGYSGSTDWHSAARARWEISKEPLQPAARGGRPEPSHWQLAMVKSNYGPEPPALCLDWDPTGPRWAVASTWRAAVAEIQPASAMTSNGNGRANYDDI